MPVKGPMSYSRPPVRCRRMRQFLSNGFVSVHGRREVLQHSADTRNISEESCTVGVGMFSQCNMCPILQTSPRVYCNRVIIIIYYGPYHRRSLYHYPNLHQKLLYILNDLSLQKPHYIPDKGSSRHARTFVDEVSPSFLLERSVPLSLLRRLHCSDFYFPLLAIPPMTFMCVGMLRFFALLMIRSPPNVDDVCQELRLLSPMLLRHKTHAVESQALPVLVLDTRGDVVTGQLWNTCPVTNILRVRC